MLIQADLHTHTIASTHAYSTITENAKYASEIGLPAIAMTDHYIKMPDSPHFWHFGNLCVLPHKLFGVTVLKGAEVNIFNYNGELDADEDMLKKLEWVVASYHKYTFPDYSPMDEKTVTDGYMKALRNPHVDVIGHPTTDFFPTDFDRFVKGCKEYGKYPEVNESSMKNKPGASKNVVYMLEACKKHEVPIVVNTDSHFWAEIAKTPICEKILTELDFPRELVFNAEWGRVREHIIKKHPNLEGEI